MNQKNRLIVEVIFSVLVAVIAYWPGGQFEAIAAKPEFVTICRIPQGVGYGTDGTTIDIPSQALQVHLDHGDSLGECA